MEPPRVDSDELLMADLREFSLHDRKGGWARALLVARRVQPRKGQGRRAELQPCSDGNKVLRRVSAQEFGRITHTDPKRVLELTGALPRGAWELADARELR
ncbi:hypothetical protein [Streptomyces zagrosensis]|uniref:Uncharacterized protein n=1 Tax=Streptomyces zagrosensis TaxID=1042984 RepID=A0A7W9QFX0_9ACTN|nr:hypothetical protein [Streptomyces zagrosensis]MBB5939536.1 hypothetical protein [Streptomyces zagrosensis]